MRRIRTFLVALVFAFPVAASAVTPDADPDGLMVAAPGAAAWIDSIVRLVVSCLGI